MLQEPPEVVDKLADGIWRGFGAFEGTGNPHPGKKMALAIVTPGHE